MLAELMTHVAEIGAERAQDVGQLFIAGGLPKWDASSVAAILVDPGGLCVALAADGLVGAALGRVVVDEAELLAIAIEETGRRRGHGMALFRAFAEFAARAGAKTIFLEVNEENSAARALYRNCGFSVHGRRSGYYPSGEDALLMRMSLPLAANG